MGVDRWIVGRGGEASPQRGEEGGDGLTDFRWHDVSQVRSQGTDGHFPVDPPEFGDGATRRATPHRVYGSTSPPVVGG